MPTACQQTVIAAVAIAWRAWRDAQRGVHGGGEALHILCTAEPALVLCRGFSGNWRPAIAALRIKRRTGSQISGFNRRDLYEFV